MTLFLTMFSYLITACKNCKDRNKKMYEQQQTSKVRKSYIIFVYIDVQALNAKILTLQLNIVS